MYNLTDYDFNAHIHLYKWEDLNILLDVNSGAIHVIDDIAYDFIEYMIEFKGDFHQAMEKCLTKYEPAKVREMHEEMLLAYENGALFSQPENFHINLMDMGIKALCLNIAHACNMKCKYCFASQGDFGLNPCLMPLEVGMKAFDLLVEKSGSVRNLEVDFFGGEPLLNFDVVRDLVIYGRKLETKTNKKFNFTLTTNATLLTEDIMDFIIDENISIILSLDGRPEVNDRNRILNDGSHTYELILPNIKKMIKKNPVSYYVRGTFTRDNMDFSKDLAHMIDQGFESISLEPAVGPDSDFSIKAEDLPRVLKEYENLTQVLLQYHQKGKSVLFFHYNLNLQKGPCLAKRQSGCGAGVEYLVITPEGDIYPCHQFVGDSNFIMGNVAAGHIDEKIRTMFAQNTLKNKDECLKCWARNFCGGGCHANNYKANGSIDKPDHVSCTMHKKRIEGAIFLDIKKQLASF